MTVTDQQIGMIRSSLTALGGLILAYFGQKGLLSPEQITFLNTQGPAILGLVMMLTGMVLSFIAHKPVNMVATVAAMPEVAVVTTMPTQAGTDLAVAANAAAGPAGTVEAGMKGML